MKVEDYIAWKKEQPKRKARELGYVEAMMITHERPGVLTQTVKSFLSKTPDMKLTIFDDGSTSADKVQELYQLARLDPRVKVMRFHKEGFITTWMNAFAWARLNLREIGGVILLEDDLSFATGWVDVLYRMYEGASDLGLMPGAMCCLRVHDVPQSRVIDLRGVPAYQSMGHSFQVNLMPWEVIANVELCENAALEARAGRHGIDVFLLGRISDRMGRTNFMSVRSWVAHEGVGKSVVKGQGYRPLEHRGYDLVDELQIGPGA